MTERFVTVTRAEQFRRIWRKQAKCRGKSARNSEERLRHLVLSLSWILPLHVKLGCKSTMWTLPARTCSPTLIRASFILGLGAHHAAHSRIQFPVAKIVVVAHRKQYHGAFDQRLFRRMYALRRLAFSISILSRMMYILCTATQSSLENFFTRLLWIPPTRTFDKPSAFWRLWFTRFSFHKTNFVFVSSTRKNEY